MARMEMVPPSDPDRMQADALAVALIDVIEDKQPSVNACMTAVATIVAAGLDYCSEAEFESALSVMCQAIRVRRALLQEPSASGMN